VKAKPGKGKMLFAGFVYGFCSFSRATRASFLKGRLTA
jgi:hypothetical protein